MNHQSKREPEFSYSKDFATPLTQTFMMAANAAYKLELGNGLSNLAKVNLFDRYIESVIAYQTVAMNGRFSSKDIDSLNNGIRGIFPKPDLTLYFDTPISVVKSRIENRGLNLDQDFYNFLSAVKSEFDKNLLDKPGVVKVNTEEDLDRITEFVIAKIEEMKEAHGLNRTSTELCFNKT